MASARLLLLAFSSAFILWMLYGALVAGCRHLVRRALVAEHRRLSLVVPRTLQIESQLAHIAGLLQHMRSNGSRPQRQRNTSSPSGS